MHEYLFDMRAFVAVRIRAPDEATARKMLKDGLDAATMALPDLPHFVSGELSMDDGEPDLMEIDGQDAD